MAQQPAYKPAAVDEGKVPEAADIVAVDTVAVDTVAVDTVAVDTVAVGIVAVGIVAVDTVAAAERVDLPKDAAAKHGFLVLSSLAARESIVGFLEWDHTQGQSRRRRLAEKFCRNQVGGKRLTGFALFGTRDPIGSRSDYRCFCRLVARKGWGPSVDPSLLAYRPLFPDHLVGATGLGFLPCCCRGQVDVLYQTDSGKCPLVVHHPEAVGFPVFAARESEQCRPAVSLARVDFHQKSLAARLAFEAPSAKVFEAGPQAPHALAENQRKPSGHALLVLVDWQSLAVSLVAKTLAASE